MKAKKWLTLLLTGALALSVGAFAACGKKDKGQSGNNDPGTNPPPATGGDYTVDTTEYYIAGKGEGSLKKIADWSNTDHTLALVRDESADHNVFKITLDLYADDAFQILHDDSWDGQMGIEYFLDVTDEGADAYEKSKGVVKNDAGNVVFYGAGMMGVDVTLEKGHDGVYTFSLHTFPDGEKDPYITYTKDAELKALMDMYVVSDMNDFSFKQQQYLDSHMNKTANGWKKVVEIKESDLKRNEKGEKVSTGAQYVAIAVRNDVADDTGYHAVTCDENRTPVVFIDGDKYNLLPAGIYTFIYNPETDTLNIVDGAFELYFVGSFNGWQDGATEEYVLTEGADGNWTGYLKLDEAAEVKLYNPLAEGWYSSEGESNMSLTAGEYFFKFTTDESKVEYEKVEYYLAGSFADVSWGIGATSPKLVWDATEKVYTVDLEDITSLEFKVVYGTVLGGVKAWHPDGMGNNHSISEAGDYTITYNPETEEITTNPMVSEVTVTFDLNYPAGVEGPEGQDAPAAQTISKRSTVNVPQEELTLPDYTFTGWYTDAACKDKFDFATPVKSNLTLYAGWILTSELPTTPTVTFDLNYEGAPEAEVVDTVEGIVPIPEEPKRDGYYFLGWYESKECKTPFDFETPITLSTTAYASWRAIDNHVYHIVGSLKSGAINTWDTADVRLTLTHNSAYPKENVFTITNVLLNVGDQFKIDGITDGWAYDAGAANLRGGNGELTGSGNIEVTVNGIYSITLNTDVWEITWTVEPIISANEMYFQVNGTEGDKLTDGGDTWTGYVTVQTGDTVKLIDKLDDNKEYAVNITEAGVYFVTFTAESGTVEVEKCEFYIVGTLVINGNKVEFSVAVNSPKLTLVDGVYTVDFEVTDVTSVDGYGWINGGIFACKIVLYKASGGIDWNYSDPLNSAFVATDDVSFSGGNLVFKTAGTYTFTFNPTTGTITIVSKA